MHCRGAFHLLELGPSIGFSQEELMSIFVVVVFLFVSLQWFCFLLSQATHFRGAQFSFRSLAANQTEISFHITWRLSYSETTHCNRSIVRSGALIGPETPGYLICDQGCRGRVGDVNIRCTDYSVLENWMTGSRAYIHTFQGNGAYELIWDGEGWFKGDVPWLFRIRMNLLRRNRTGRANSSPRAVMSPLPISLQQGCGGNIRINVSDDDGDVVRCRWAQSRRQECGGVCHDSFDTDQLFVTLDESKCSLQLNESVLPGEYIIALQLEDFDLEDLQFQSPLSSVPLQFSISVYNSSASSSSSQSNSTAGASSSAAAGANASAIPSWCQVAPVFVPPTPNNGSCWSLRKENSSRNIIIAAEAKDSITRVSQINAVEHTDANFSVSDVAVNGSVYYVIMTLNSDFSALEGKTFCFEAIDNFGFVSKVICFNASFGLNPPKAISSTFDSNRERIVIRFNQQVERPLERRLVTVNDLDNGSEVANYDTSNASLVTFELDAIAFTPTDQISATPRCFYLLLQEGVVLNQCGTPSLKVVNSSALNFTTVFSGSESCSFYSTVTTTKATDSTTAKQQTSPAAPPSSSSSPRAPAGISPPGNASSVDGSGSGSGGSGSGSWDYRWLIVAIVCSVVLFSAVVLLAAFVYKRRNSRSNDRRMRQERFFNTLNSRGIYNWAYDQQFTPSPSDTTTDVTPTTTTVTPQHID